MAEKTLLDVTVIEPRFRHPKIFGLFEDMPVGDSIILRNDHDPKPLRYQFAAEYPDAFEWGYLKSGPDIWEVEITKRSETKANEAEVPEWLPAKAHVVLDVREMIARNEEPYNVIMEAVARVKAGQTFLLINSFKPAPLIRILEGKGYKSFARKSTDGSFETYFQNKGAETHHGSHCCGA